MDKMTRLVIAAALIAGPSLLVLAQIEPPPGVTTAPASEPAAERSATMPATGPAPAALPSSQSILEGLLNGGSAPAPISHPANPASTNPALTPTLEAAAPNEPKAIRLREGQMIYNRTGRLVRDEKSGTYVFAFDGDGKNMADPPMALVPSHLLMSMEDASDKGTRPVKFKITGEVTEYRGKNYLYVRMMQAVKDLNQGLGG